MSNAEINYPMTNIHQEIYYLELFSKKDSASKVDFVEHYHVNNFTIHNSEIIRLNQKAINDYIIDFVQRRSNFFGLELKILTPNMCLSISFMNSTTFGSNYSKLSFGNCV